MAIRTLGRGRALTTLGLVAATAVGFWLGRGGPQSTAIAAPPAPAAPTPPTPPSDYSQRVVAYIYQSVPITREDLGEYLIARKGLDNIDNLVNRKIIDLACEKRGVTVTDAEVEAVLMRDLEPMKINKAEFVQRVLKQRGMTLWQYKEDVLKPAILMSKLVKEGIKVDDDEIHKAFEASYGRQVAVRIIIWPKGEEKIALKEYDAIRKDEQAFDRAARSQANSTLAAIGGKVRPIAHHAGAHPEVEQQAFSLQPGEVSRLIGTPEGTLVLKVDGVIEPDPNIKLEAKRDELYKQVFDMKVNAEMPRMFKQLREEAKPVFIMKKPQGPADIDRAAIEQEIKQTGGPEKPKP